MYNRGFTMIELLVAITLMGLVVSLAIPSLTRFNNRSSLEAEAVAFADVLNQARSYAENGVQNISTSQADRYQVSMLRESGGAASCFRGYALNHISEPPSPVSTPLSENSAKCGVYFTSTWQQIEFDVPNGNTMVNAPQTILACSPNIGSVLITIDQTGKVTRGQLSDSLVGCSCTMTCNSVVTPVPTPP